MINMLEIYTDGSCSTNLRKGGWGYVVLDNEVVKHEDCGAEDDTTNNRMELTALLKGIQWVENNFLYAKDVVVYTDSSYIANCFKEEWYKRWRSNGWRTANRVAVKNQDLWREILNLYERGTHNIEIVYVKGHAENKWNNSILSLYLLFQFLSISVSSCDNRLNTLSADVLSIIFLTPTCSALSTGTITLISPGILKI